MENRIMKGMHQQTSQEQAEEECVKGFHIDS